MKLPVQLRPEAERELEDAFWCYECQRSGLGSEFLLAFDAAVEGLRRLPEGHELVALRTRKVLLRRLPYLLLYVVERDRVLITAVFHGRRDPRRRSDRVRESVVHDAETRERVRRAMQELGGRAEG